jgi:hypothetical protein
MSASLASSTEKVALSVLYRDTIHSFASLGYTFLGGHCELLVSVGFQFKPFEISGTYTLYQVGSQKHRVAAASVLVSQRRMGARNVCAIVSSVPESSHLVNRVTHLEGEGQTLRTERV